MPVGPENKCGKKNHFFRVAEVVDIWMVFFLFIQKPDEASSFLTERVLELPNKKK